MKTCAQTFRYICDNLDADVNSPQCVAIRKHLSQCPNCRVYLATLKETISLYQKYTPPPVSPKIHAVLMEKLLEERRCGVRAGRGKKKEPKH